MMRVSRARLCAVLGGSQWLGDYVIADPARARAIWEDPGEAVRVMLASVGATRVESGVFVASEDAGVDDLAWRVSPGPAVPGRPMT